MLEPGTPAPDFDLQNQNGDVVRLSNYRGRRVVVYFYPRADTPGCTREATSFRDAWDRFAGRDVPVLGISDDPVEDLAAFADSYDLPFYLLSDESGAVAGAYDSYGEKTLGDRTIEGVSRNTYVIGPETTVEAAMEGVDPEDHAEEVLATLDELGG